jgi:Tol biopolymer transport system component
MAPRRLVQGLVVLLLGVLAPACRKGILAPAVGGNGNSVSPYYFADVYEPNDSSYGLTPLGAGFGRYTVEATITPQGDVDWFAFSVDAGTEIIVTLDTPYVGYTLSPWWGHDAPYGIWLFDPSLVMVKWAGNTSNASMAYTALATGTYFLKIDGEYGILGANGQITTGYESSAFPYTLTVTAQFPAARPIERVSISSGGIQGNGESRGVALSADGRYAVFVSDAANLAGGASGSGDVFVKDRLWGATTLVSVSLAGSGAGSCREPSVSADGRYVAFASLSPGLVPGDTNGVEDVFVRDRASGTTRRVSVASDGSQANGASRAPAISADGRTVAYYSEASNLTSTDSNGTAGDVFLYDLETGETILVSVDSSGVPIGAASDGPSISADGTRVAFTSAGQIYVRDRAVPSTILASVSVSGAAANGPSSLPALSPEGSCVAFLSTATDLVRQDLNGFRDAFVRHLTSQYTARVSATTVLANEGNGEVLEVRPALSAYGNQVVFVSAASNLLDMWFSTYDKNGVPDAFVHGWFNGAFQTARLSESAGGAEGNASSGWGWALSISKDGRYVAFGSQATNLVSGDSNAVADVFVTSHWLAP